MTTRQSAGLTVRSLAATLTLVASVSWAAAPLRAQGRVSTAGALELGKPVGAAASALGQAAVADFLGSESIWWNPGALARATTREIAVHHSDFFAVTGDALAVVLPSRIGTVAFSADLYDYGTQDNTDASGTLGSFGVRATILTATFAGRVGSRANVGVNYKHYSRGISCTGNCTDLPTWSQATTAIDLGGQVRVFRDSTLYVGFSLRNVGPKLQVRDSPQADPADGSMDVGLTWRPRIQSLGPDAELKLATDVVKSVVDPGLGLRVGADIGWQHTLHASAGYVYGGSDEPGPTIGVGATTGRLRIDIARLMSTNSADANSPPTYLSLRVMF